MKKKKNQKRDDALKLKSAVETLTFQTGWGLKKLCNEDVEKYDELSKVEVGYITELGLVQDILSMMPGMDAKALSGANIDEKAMARTEAIIQSMTPYERENPGVIGSSRRKRIAAGSGTTVIDVNKLLRQFDAMQKLMKQVNGMSGKKKKRMQRMGGFPGMPGGFGF